MTCGSRASAAGGAGRIAIRLGGILGRGLYQGLGRMSPPGPFPFSDFLSFFFISDFRFVSNLLQIWFKLIQTKF
jgi:hypothetical protein